MSESATPTGPGHRPAPPPPDRAATGRPRGRVAAERGLPRLAPGRTAAARRADPAAARPDRRLAAPGLLRRCRTWPRCTVAGRPAVLAGARLGVYPVLVAPRLALRRPRGAQRAGLRRPDQRAVDEPGRAARRHRGQPWSRSPPWRSAPGAAALPHHQRLLRRLAHGQPAAERERDRRRVPLGRIVPRASPGCCSPSAPRCSGTRSAGPRATSSCSPWSPRRCAARAPTRSRTSPRRGSAPEGSRGVLAAGGGHRLALPDPAVPGGRPHPALGGRARPPGSAPLVVGLVVLANIGSGGMRSITFVQAFQYWLKLTALLLPAAILLAVWAGDGAPSAAGGAADAMSTVEWSTARWPTGRPRALPHLLADPGDVPRHHGPAARRGPLLHQPRRPGRPPHDPGRARAARPLLRPPAGLRRARPGLRRRAGGVRPRRTPWCSSCRG